MGFLGRLAKFTGGGLLGVAIGATVAALLAPQSGEELQARVRERLDAAKVARAEAEEETKARLRAEFRQTVKDPNALQVQQVEGE